MLAHATELPKARAVPGGVALLPLPAHLSASKQAPSVTFDSQRVMVLRQDGGWLAVIGIPLSAAVGPASAEVSVTDGPVIPPLTFQIAPKAYRTQQLSVERAKVDLSAEDLARFAQEKTHLQTALSTFSERPPATLH